MRKISQTVLLTFLGIYLPLRAQSQALNTVYDNSTLITISSDIVSGSSDIVNFPLLLDIADNTTLLAAVQADGFDIVFSELENSAEGDRYNHYLENYNSGTGALIIWVQIPNLSASVDTELYMHFGITSGPVGADQSSSTVWTDAGFMGVWQLSETPGVGTVVDASGTSANGTANGNVTQVASVVGLGYSFDGDGDYVSIPGINAQPAGSFTVSCWFQTSGTQNAYAKMFSKGRTAAPYASYTLEMRPQTPGNGLYDDEVGFQTGRTAGAPGYILTDTNNNLAQVDPSKWYYFVGTYEDLGGSSYEQKVYLNGLLITTNVDNNPIDFYPGDGGAYPYPLIIGGIYSTFLDNEFTGIIDELRIANGVRSAEYIRTELRNTACVANFIDIAIGDLNCTDEFLPIELKRFSAERSAGHVLLKWATASEKNNDYFTIERSVNGKDFVEIANIPGAGSTNETKNYEYRDLLPLTGVVYYKLKQTDFDGSFEYSEIISVNDNWNNLPEINVYPNPSDSDRNEITLDFSGDVGSSVRVEVFSFSGKRLSTATFQPASTGFFKEKIDISRLGSGAYILSIKTDSYLFSEILQIK